MIKFIENKLVPILIKIGENKILVAVRNGITLTLPFTISGSLFLILANLPIPGWSDFLGPFADKLSAPVAVTFGAIGIISAIGISYNLAKQYKLDAITCSAITMVVFLLAQLDQEYTLNVDNLGAAGLFSAIILSIITVHIIKFFISRNIVIKLPEGVPPAVAQSFAGLVPAAVAIVLIWFIRVLLNFDINAFFTWILSPLVMGLGTLPGMLILIFLISILWCCGIHGDNVLSGITSPIFLKYIAENTQAYLNHQPIPHITADGFYIVFMCLGGTGATLGLVISMLRSKSKLYKSVGELSLPSAIFCINEPVIFGFPVVFNPIMMIPFILAPVSVVTVSYWAMKLGLVAKLVGVAIPWTTPPILGGYLATGNKMSGAVLQAFNMVLTFVIYYPFFKLLDKQKQKEEGEALSMSAGNVSDETV